MANSKKAPARNRGETDSDAEAAPAPESGVHLVPTRDEGYARELHNFANEIRDDMACMLSAVQWLQCEVVHNPMADKYVSMAENAFLAIARTLTLLDWMADELDPQAAPRRKTTD